MSAPTLCLKPIDDLLSERFFIPSYQRGYRWTERQVTELLDDIWDFQHKTEKKEDFYCLQPIVVKKRTDGAWELVDGQQRLTTIFLILTYHKALVETIGKPRFDLSFETRPNSEDFLNEIDSDREDENIDFFHICKAYSAIERWSTQRGGSQALNLIQCLTNDEESGKNVKVIWYELPSTEDPVEAFTRLNVGKIPLTSSELIRALFLRSRNFEDGATDLHQLKIAQEWDAIEKTLQSDEVWYFLHAGKSNFSSRIEFVFERLAELAGRALGPDPFATFHFFSERLESSDDVEAKWLEVKQCFMTLEEWFNDRLLYHYVGFLIHEQASLRAMLADGRKLSKTEFKKSLKTRIYETLIGSPFPLDLTEITPKIQDFVNELDYSTSRKKILSTLLLFNIATLILAEKSKLRFPFEHFKKESWDIEHVHSVKSDKPEREKQALDWLKSFCNYIGTAGEEDDFETRARSLQEPKQFEMSAFDALYTDVLTKYQEDNDLEIDNSIGNLALLDAGTNRSYKNAVFPIKRQRVLELERNGMFVPPCTNNVFLKSYSTNVGKMFFWGKSDRDAYRDSIIRTLSDFFVYDGEN